MAVTTNYFFVIVIFVCQRLLQKEPNEGNSCVDISSAEVSGAILGTTEQNADGCVWLVKHINVLILTLGLGETEHKPLKSAEP